MTTLFRCLGISLLTTVVTAPMSMAQAAPTFDFKDLVITEGVGLIEQSTNAKYITLGMTEKRVRANEPRLDCPPLASFCAVRPTSETGWIRVFFDAEKRVTQLTFDQNYGSHKWPSRKGAVDGMTLAQVHALYKGSILTADGDPTQFGNGMVVTKTGNYQYGTSVQCTDQGCTYGTLSHVWKGSKAVAQ